MNSDNKDNGLMTKVWGPPGWLFFHCIAFGYPYKIDDSNYEHFEKKIIIKNFMIILVKYYHVNIVENRMISL